MKEIPRISDTEWQVMKVIWANSPCSANNAIEILSESTKWMPNTIKTLLSRLVNKKVLGYTKESRAFIYYPLVTEEQCIKIESQSFLEKVFNGSINVMMAKFLDGKTLSQKEYEELKKILEDSKNK